MISQALRRFFFKLHLPFERASQRFVALGLAIIVATAALAQPASAADKKKGKGKPDAKTEQKKETPKQAEVKTIANPAEPKKDASGDQKLVSTRAATGASNYTTDDEVIAYINSQIEQGWKDAELTASPKATDGEWCRRAYLDILGRVPTVEELRHYLAIPSAEKKSRLVDQLLNSEQYNDDYAHNWTTIWSNLLVGRPPARRNRRDMVNREGMSQYLRSSFLRNKPYDQMVYELVTATGTTKPGSPDYNGAVNFLIDKLKENATEATSKTAKIFLGMQVQCTQCHNHPFNDWKQDQFWSMNAFFRQTTAKATRDGRDIDYSTLSNQNFKGEGNTPGDAEIYFELRNGQLQVAYPKFIDGTEIEHSGYVKDVNRRDELGKLVIKSPYLGKAMANRMWAHFLGYGFTKPVDDMGPHNQASHPDLLDRLGKEFAAHGYDVKRLIRWIVLSEPYALSSRVTASDKKDDPTLGERPKFSHFYLRQMQAEQLYDSMLVVTNAHKRPGTYEEKFNERANLLRQFTITFGNDEGDEATTFNGTIPQALMMMNGEMIREATNTKQGSFLRKLSNSGLSPTDGINLLFEAAIARKPTAADMMMAKSLLITRGNNVLSAYEDIWWALLNSNEFIFVH
jgi:hypothetical protein